MEKTEIEKFNSTCVYYDKDLKKLEVLFDQTYNILSEISSRFARRDTLEISTSVFNYMEKSVLKVRDPHPFYRFCLDDIEIFIFCPRKGHFNIRLNNVEKRDLPDLGFIPYLDFENCWVLPNSVTDLEISVKTFKNIVEQFLTKLRFEYGLF